jgi:predicted phosphodiesterase
MTPHAPDSNGAPSKIALVSDVHGNLPAFRSVLTDVERSEPDAIWCLGDLVGYGAQPDGCVELAAASCDLTLAGNHDLGVIGRIDISDFSPNAAAAALWTRANICRETAEFLSALEPQLSGQAVGLYHASPLDPVWDYVTSASGADRCMDEMEERVSAIGHTHVASRFTRTDTEVYAEAVEGGSRHDLSDHEWLINPGSVGQPRDGDPRAAWLMLDLDAWSAEWHRVEYPVEEAAGAIEDAGLPRSLGDRLHVGQ